MPTSHDVDCLCRLIHEAICQGYGKDGVLCRFGTALHNTRETSGILTPRAHTCDFRGIHGHGHSLIHAVVINRSATLRLRYCAAACTATARATAAGLYLLLLLQGTCAWASHLDSVIVTRPKSVDRDRVYSSILSRHNALAGETTSSITVYNEITRLEARSPLSHLEGTHDAKLARLLAVRPLAGLSGGGVAAGAVGAVGVSCNSEGSTTGGCIKRLNLCVSLGTVAIRKVEHGARGVS
mmetsp:Transcript_46371/g.68089  ORF Transcript_46371/g.68089 Transcript_46371/m.68089 type:complete len:239 (-) Transcript_46371:1290-2006(-)